MPNKLHIDNALIDELVKRQIEDEQQAQLFAPRPQSPPQRPSEMSPETLALLGGLADAASTYTFLKQGAGTESNAMYRPLKNKPLATGLAVAGTALGAKGLRHLFRKKAPGLVNALAANQGAMQLGLGAANIDDVRASSDDQWMEALKRARLQNNK